MKIGMIVHAYYLKDARVRRYAETLTSRGHQVDVLCLREGDEPKTSVHNGVSIFRVNMARKRQGRLSYIFEYLQSFFSFFFKLNQLTLKGRRYDVLHVHNMPDFLVFSALFQRLAGVKIILDVHDLMPEVFQSKYQLHANHWLPRLLCIEERLSSRFATAVIAANHAFADILVERGLNPSKVTVVMNAADEQFFLSEDQIREARSAKPEGEFQVIYIGTLAPRYGVEHAIRTIAKLRREAGIPGLKFSIIPKITNEGHYVDDLIAEVARLEIQDCFEMMEPVPHDQMPMIIAKADAMIYTPTPDVHMDIALSLKIPEAVAVGCPIVASRLSVNVRYFGDEGLFMFEPGNIDECAARIKEIYDEPEKVQVKREQARRKLEEISWSRQANKYLALVTENDLAKTPARMRT